MARTVNFLMSSLEGGPLFDVRHSLPHLPCEEKTYQIIIVLTHTELWRKQIHIEGRGTTPTLSYSLVHLELGIYEWKWVVPPRVVPICADNLREDPEE